MVRFNNSREGSGACIVRAPFLLLSFSMSRPSVWELPLDLGVPYDPARHQVVETMLAAKLRTDLLNPRLFVYRHLKTQRWMVAQWLDEAKTRFREFWGSDKTDAHVESLISRDVLQEIKDRIVRVTGVAEHLAKAEEARREAELAWGREQWARRADLVKHLKRKWEKQGQLPGDRALHLHSLKTGGTPTLFSDAPAGTNVDRVLADTAPAEWGGKEM